MNPATGSKRPALGEGQYVPRKRPAVEDDDMMEEDFDLEPPEDDFDEGPDIEVGEEWGGRPARAGGKAGLCQACTSHPVCVAECAVSEIVLAAIKMLGTCASVHRAAAACPASAG